MSGNIEADYVTKEARDAKSNKYQGDYDPNKESANLIYLGANNLHGWAMSQYLLYSKTSNLITETTSETIFHTVDNNPKGYTVEVDLWNCLIISTTILKNTHHILNH